MKYSALKPKEKKLLSICAASKGIDLSQPTANIENENLGFSKNIIYENGVLKNRKGLVGKTKNILDTSLASFFYEKNYYLTDAEYLHNGELKRVAYSYVVESESNYLIFVYLIAKDGSATSCGYISFLRVTSDIFYVPVQLTFFTGAPQAGGGIFCFATCENEDGKKDYRVFEVLEDLSGWEYIYSYYTPTVYINGRGNSYEEARADNQVSSLTPMALEPLNMLYERFHAYFTSDGYSSSFRLPFTDISSSAVQVRVHTTINTYADWRIEANATSCKSTFMGGEVTANIDRSKGTVYFTNANGLYSIPISQNYRENNIKITAGKDIEADYISVVSSTSCVKYGSKLIFSGGVNNNRIFCSNCDNPLYFPKLSNNEIGSADSKITALTKIADKIYAFKENEIYEVTLGSAKALNSVALLADNGKIFIADGDFKISCVSDIIGSVFPQTASSIKGIPIFLAEDKKIYTFKNKTPVCISEKIHPLLEDFTSWDLKSAVATVFGNTYIICINEKCFLINLNDINEPVCYYWQFPENIKICGVYDNNSDLIFLCKNIESHIAYTASLKDEDDTVVVNSDTVLQNQIISTANFKSHYIGLPFKTTYLHSIFLNISFKDKVILTIGENSNKAEFTLNKCDFCNTSQNSIKLLTNNRGIDLLEMSLYSNKGFSFYGAEIYYTQSGD